MATPQRTPRSHGGKRDTSHIDDLVDRVTEEVTAKVSRKLDQVAEKTKAKIDAASNKADAKLRTTSAKLDRQQAQLDRRGQQHADAFERLAVHLDALEVWTRGAGGGRRPRFSRDEIAEAAVQIADSEGFEALSMRRLAAELGAGTMTLYHYIRTKDELLTLVNDAVMGEVVLPPGEALPGDWREAITVIAERTRASIERHPWLLDLVDDPQLGPNAVRHFGQSMQAVAPLGASLEERLDIVTAVDEYVFGYCVHARNNMHPEHDGGGDDYAQGLVEYIEGLLATGEYPQLEELTQEQSVAEILEMAEEHSRDPDRFRRNLDRLLDGIEADVAKGRRTRRKS